MVKDDFVKEALLPSTASDAAPRKKGGCRAGLAVVKALLLGLSFWVCLNALGLAPVPACLKGRHGHDGGWKADEQCPQATATIPKKNVELWTSLGETFNSDAFKARAVEWIGGAVRVP